MGEEEGWEEVMAVAGEGELEMLQKPPCALAKKGSPLKNKGFLEDQK